MRSFSLPLIMALRDEGFKTAMICNMSKQFIDEFSKDCLCIHIDISRGFHPFNLLKTIFDFIKIFKKEQFDIVQYGTENAAFCASIAAWMVGIPIRIYEHWGARYIGYDGVMRFISKMIERTAAFFSTDVRQVSYKNMEMCVKDRIYKQEKVKVLGKGGTVGVDFSQFDLSQKAVSNKSVRTEFNIPDNACIFGFVGRIQRDKGINELLVSFKKIFEKDKETYLMLVGAIDEVNPVAESNMSWAKECSHVIFTGYVKDVYRYMSAFDLLVHPTYREGFGMVLQEAAALKIPIITTNINGPGEYIIDKDTGYLVEAKDSEALFFVMNKLYRDEAERNRMAEKNYRYTLNYFERSVMVDNIIRDRLELMEKLKISKK